MSRFGSAIESVINVDSFLYTTTDLKVLRHHKNIFDYVIIMGAMTSTKRMRMMYHD